MPGPAMQPFYIYYSMFGFQRVGDLIWAAADQRPLNIQRFMLPQWRQHPPPD